MCTGNEKGSDQTERKKGWSEAGEKDVLVLMRVSDSE